MKIGNKEGLPMKVRKMRALLLIVFVLVCSGCGSGGRELTVGTYNEHDEIVLDQERTVTDAKTIDKVKSILADRSTGAARTDGKPDYVVMIHNKDDSTMEIGAELWHQEDGTMIAGRVFGGGEAYTIDRANADAVLTALGIQDNA